MTGPTGTPRGERPGTPGTRWETRLVTSETIVPDDDWDTPLPRPSRAARRAAKRQQHPNSGAAPASASPAGE